ncbi:Gamma-soluble NSF attachment protein [Diplonema papillatum]|nr:Gamma-soluble NSF attachment protein [Diplonema papillatum]
MSESSRLEEAAKHIKSAKKRLKTGITKWTVSSSDYDVAALEYEQAAKIYQHLKRTDEAIEAWQQAAEYHSKAGGPFSQGRAFDSIAAIYKDNKNVDKMASYMAQAAECYLEDNKPDKFAEGLLRAAKGIQAVDPDRANAMLEKAMGALADAEMFHLMPEYGRQRVAINVKAAKLLDAANCVKQNLAHFAQLNQDHNVSRGVLEVVVLHLARDDAVMAEREFKQLSDQYPNTMNSDDAVTCMDLIEAYQKFDAEMLASVLGRQIITFMQPDIARLTRKMTIKGAKVKPAVAPAAAVPATTPAEKGSPTTASPPTEQVADAVPVPSAAPQTAPAAAADDDSDEDDWR